ncbi:SanA/YdcF family protein [Streptomyces montanisoli]|nr:ElyC/SanA/YdcF family protein [Streptomyces montanisoli]
MPNRTAGGGRAARLARAIRDRLRTRRGQRRLTQAVMGVCTLALVPSVWLHQSADGRIRTAADVPARDVAVVFGAGLRDGTPSPYLAHRLDTAALLYRTGKARVVLVTGDNSRKDYDEPDAMRRYLTRHGVPRGRIVDDYAGFDTWDSCVRAKKIFGVRQAILVTQDFHVTRALALCAAAGIDAYGVPVAEPHDVTWYYGGAREVLAADKASLDALLRPAPTFLGPREHGVARALASDGDGNGGGSGGGDGNGGAAESRRHPPEVSSATAAR